MMMHDVIELLAKAEAPEDVFGSIDDTPLSKRFSNLAKIVHPDKHGGDAHAGDLFKCLSSWYKRAQDKVANGTYGDRSALGPIKVTSHRSTYTITARLQPGSIADVYTGTDADDNLVVVKIVRTPGNNSMMAAAAQKLKYMSEEVDTKDLKVTRHIPRYVDDFRLSAAGIKRHVLVTSFEPGGVTLQEVHAAYPEGLDPRDMAWMLNRLLGALLDAHQNGFVHGAVVPEHVIVFPENHNGLLIDWTHAVETGQQLKTIVPSWKHFYPEDALVKRAATPGMDIYMAAKCALYITNGGKTLPYPITGLLRSCILGAAYRPGDVFEVFDDFQTVLKGLYGPRKFKVFEMPSTLKG